MTTTLLDVDTPITSLREAHRFIVDSLTAVGVPQGHAKVQADLLIEADYRGHYSHGMNRIELYLNDIESGLCDSAAIPQIIKETPATAWVDGKNSLGAVVGNFCMSVAIQKAKEIGVGFVVVKGSNHYGIAGMYAMQAMREGLLGLSFTNTSPAMTPTRAKEAAFGTNPLSLAAPATKNDDFVLDMATTTVAQGKIEMQRRKNLPLPNGWALDESGKAETNAEKALKSVRMMPLGGFEETSGYKGTGLAMLVEIFCGILSGGTYGPNIRKWKEGGDVANLSHCFIAINPNCFAPGFEDRMKHLMDQVRKMEPASIDKPVLVPGDPEKLHMRAVDESGGVRYVPDQHITCNNIAKKLKIRPLSSSISTNSN